MNEITEETLGNKATKLTVYIQWDSEDGYDHPKDWFVRQTEKYFADEMGLYVECVAHEDLEPIHD